MLLLIIQIFFAFLDNVIAIDCLTCDLLEDVEDLVFSTIRACPRMPGSFNKLLRLIISPLKFFRSVLKLGASPFRLVRLMALLLCLDGEDDTWSTPRPSLLTDLKERESGARRELKESPLLTEA